MYQLIKKSLTDKAFYSKGFKSVSRLKTILYVFLICLLFALFTSPTSTAKSYKSFFNLKEQVLELPYLLEINYSSNQGLSTNVESPIILEIEKNNYMIVDPNANYKSKGMGNTEVIFRKKGYMTYQNGDLTSQLSYNLPEFMDFNLTSSYLKDEFNSVPTGYVLFVLAVSTLIGNFLLAIINLFLMVIMFGSMSFVVNKLLLKSEDTLAQNYKKMLFLGVFFLIGTAINMLIGGSKPIFDILLLGLGYFLLIR